MMHSSKQHCFRVLQLGSSRISYFLIASATVQSHTVLLNLLPRMQCMRSNYSRHFTCAIKICSNYSRTISLFFLLSDKLVTVLYHTLINKLFDMVKCLGVTSRRFTDKETKKPVHPCYIACIHETRRKFMYNTATHSL